MFVISQLEDKNDPKLITLEMQFYFTCSLDNMNNVVRRNRANTLNRLARLKNKIIYSKKPTSDKEIDNLNKIFVYYITLTSGLGNPKENEVCIGIIYKVYYFIRNLKILLRYSIDIMTCIALITEIKIKCLFCKGVQENY